MSAILEKITTPESPTLCFNRIGEDRFREIVSGVVAVDQFYQKNLSVKESYADHECWLSDDRKAGFAVSPDCELINVFSMVKGHGNKLMNFANQRYQAQALHLNCFGGGYLETFYGAHGFEVTLRQPNWSPGKPDVVFMRRGAINIPL